MDTETKYERPNTVAGLVAKHKELSALRIKYKAEVKKLGDDIEHLKAAIRVFDPHGETYAMQDYVTAIRLPRGAVKRFLLSTLREASEPMTSRQLAETWAEEQGFEMDRVTINKQRSRITSCIKDAAKQGLVECIGTRRTDMNVPYKLWQLKRGDV